MVNAVIIKTILFCIFICPFLLTAQLVLPAGFTIETIAVGLQAPTSLTSSHDGRIFITEKSGEVRVIQDDILLPDPLYVVNTETFVERGLLNILLHPDFNNTPEMFLFYTVPDVNHNRLLKIDVNGNSAVLGSEEIIMDFDPMSSNHHNGGGMATDDNGHLFLALGDGTNAPTAQSLLSTNGSVLRMNLDGTIPTDNPFYNSATGNRRAIWSMGLRNPFTMSKQESTGKFFFNDVGEASYEEVNEVFEAANYGWPLIEGPIQGQNPPDGYLDPIHYYDHSEGCAIVGADFYEPDDYTFPAIYHNKYFFMDYCEGYVKVLDPLTNDVFQMISGLHFPIDLEFDHDGNMYILKQVGEVLKVSFSGTGEPYIIQQPQDAIMAVGEDLILQVLAGGDAPLSYQWFNNSIAITGATDSTLFLNNLTLLQNGDQFHCEISNTIDTINSNIANLQVIDGDRPIINIQSPLLGTLYSGGDSLLLMAEAEDLEDGILNPDSIIWKIDFYHNIHKHPVIGPMNESDSTWFVVPNTGELDVDVFYRFIATIVDSDGLTSFDTLDIHPEIVTITIDSDIGLIGFTLDASILYSGESMQSVKGMQRTIQASEYFVYNDSLLKFNDWASGSSDLIQIYIAKDTLIEASYTFLHEYIEGENTENLIASFYEGTGINKTFLETIERDVINDSWGTNTPIPGVLPVDSFGVKYQGKILAPYTGEYTLYVYHDGFASLSSEFGELTNSTFPNYVKSTDSVTVQLVAGNFYPFQILYENYFLHSRLKFSWRFSELNQELIPASQLYYPDFDLSLTNVLSDSGTFFPGDEITFDLQITNQGSEDAIDITLIDYVPDGMTLSDPDWNPDGTYNMGYLEAQATALVQITLNIDSDFEGSERINRAEILSHSNGADLPDIDSTPDGEALNDAGGSSGTASDNAIDGNGTGSPGDASAETDEDDHDPEKILVCNDVPFPEGLQSTYAPAPAFNPNTYLLSWNPIPGSTVCQIKGGESGGTDPTSLLVYGIEPHEKLIYTASLTPGQTYQWKVRCACSIEPIVVAGDFSDYDYFTIAFPTTVVQSFQEQTGSEENGKKKLLVYPNPNDGSFILNTNLTNYFVQINDITGKTIFLRKDEIKNTLHFEELDLSPGIYFIRVSNSKFALTEKIMIE